ncbi:DUF4439 domain-containing protein [Arthrobacter celericrescens]|uniref:DUF4439 domain-containing protein n=1 Tax=Arthrobacter celericrescens TaxID=2320851 RepID=UPI001FE1042F|nr:DUF4439 domain-containing protein [Arthrobacter celericrescens]
MSLLAILVVGTGAVLLPPNEGPAPEPPFSETAKAAAYAEARALLADAEGSGSPGSTVALLETQARALLAPAAASPSASASASSAALAPVTKTRFVAWLARSASERLADAGNSDGGTARLLAAVGTAQFLEAARLAAAWGLPAPVSPSLLSTAVSSPAAAAACAAGKGSTATATAVATADQAGPREALAAVVRAEQKAVYVYQVALARLDGSAAEAAAADLARHQDLLREAEALARQHCTEPPPREAGYRLPAGFAAHAAAALGEQESATLAAYGELVALADGETRQWAMAGLLGGARRTESWGISPGILPGLPVDPAELPTLPARTAVPER